MGDDGGMNICVCYFVCLLEGWLSSYRGGNGVLGMILLVLIARVYVHIEDTEELLFDGPAKLTSRKLYMYSVPTIILQTIT